MRWRRAGTACDLIVRPDTHAPRARSVRVLRAGPRADRSRSSGADPRAGPAAGDRRARRVHGVRRRPRRRARPRRRRCSHGISAVASLLLRLPRPASAARLRIARLCARGRGGAAASSSTATPGAREAPTARRAGGARVARRRRVCHDYRGARGRLRRRFGAARRVAVIPDGVAGSRRRGPAEAGHDRVGDVMRPVVAYAGHLYAWKGVDVLLDALALVPESHGLDRRGARRSRTSHGCRRWRGARHRRPRDVHRHGCVRPSARAAAAARRPGAAEPGVGHLDAVHLAAEAVRVHGGGPRDRRVGSAVDPRGAARRASTRCWSRRETRGDGRRDSPRSLAIRRSPRVSARAARAEAARNTAGTAAPSGSKRCSTEVLDARTALNDRRDLDRCCRSCAVRSATASWPARRTR